MQRRANHRTRIALRRGASRPHHQEPCHRGKVKRTSTSGAALTAARRHANDYRDPALDLTTVASPNVASFEHEEKAMEFQVESMSCGHCVSAVTRAVQALDAAAKVEVDLARHRVQVETSKSRDEVAAAIEAAGYTAA